jgi:hypothetical protein
MSELTSSPNGVGLRPGDAVRRSAKGLHDLIGTLRDMGNDVVGPTVRAGAIVPGRFGSAHDLPVGWRDEQSPRRYGIHSANDELALVHAYEPSDPPAIEVPPQAGIGTGATEAPRGLLVHQYGIVERGTIPRARIVPPTSQNQLTIEGDLRRVALAGLDPDDHDLQERCEQAVRNRDPCISCAAHFFDPGVVRS